MNTADGMGQLDSMELAGNMLERHDMQDLNSPSLTEVTGIAQHGVPTASGLNDYDYQALTTLSLGHKNLNQIVTTSKVPIPTEVMEHFKHVKCHCMMGLFPEIGRAWLTIDSDIYIWTYEQTRDVAYFDGLSHLIVSVALVRPKAGVFISDVKYLLVLTTPIEIIVLGVTFGDSTKSISSPAHTPPTVTTFEEMQLMSKPIFVLNTDNVAISCIEGTQDGRILLGGRDGCLYEVAYQAESNWFGKRCKKINHSQSLIAYMVPGFLKVFSETDAIVKIVVDNSRGLLYVLTEKGAIEGWDLGPDSNSMRRFARISANDIAYSASNILKTVEAAVFKPVTAICPLSGSDSANLHLIGVTHSGVRFYFAVTALNMGPMAFQGEAPRAHGLYLLHVRLPPGYTPNAAMGKPKQVHSAFYNHGSLLVVSTPQPDQDLLWSLSSEPFPHRPFLVESSTVLPLDGQVWSIAETRKKSKSGLESPLRRTQTASKIVLLTNQGAHIVALLKPLDLLHQLLIACGGPHHEAVKAYFQTQGEVESCASALGLACLESLKGTEIVPWATQAFFLYGGEPHFGSHQLQSSLQGRLNSSGSFVEQQAGAPRIFMSTPFAASRPASSVQQSLMQQTQFPTSPISPIGQNGIGGGGQGFAAQSMPDAANLNYSAKHAGLYLHLARLLRPVWKRRCIDPQQCSTVTQQDCAELLADLYAIKAFLEANSASHISGMLKLTSNQNQIVMSSPYGAFNQNQLASQQKKNAEDALAEEKKSLDALNRFIKHTCEVVALWKILCEHQFHQLVAKLPHEQQNILAACTFRDLILTRTDTCALLIVALINTYLNDNANVGSISSKLRDVCPSLYRHEDAVSHKATEILMHSKTLNDAEEKDERLRRALELCKGAAPNLPLASICQQFTLAGFYRGVVELCATCAAKIDPNDTALHFYRAQEPVEDQEGFMAYNARRECYKEVHEMLEAVWQTATSAGVAAGADGGQRASIAGEVLQIVRLALQAPDKLLHNAVYEWLLARSLLAELLDIAEPSLGEFLAHSAAKTPDSLQLTDLLWKYHEKNGQHAAAARILDSLASTDSETVSLVQRIEYLARAIMCMRSDSVGYSAHNGVLLKDLEDKLEIARVQKKILDAISSFQPSNITRDAIRSLNSSLFNMTHLYSDFCEDFDLWECKLTILNASHHNDPILIEQVWSQILDKEMEVPGSPADRVQRLLSKMRALTNEYGSSGYCFPLSFIVRELEVRCFKLKVYESPVPEALVSMGLEMDVLLDIYSGLVSMNERIWQTEDDDLYLIRATIKLLTILVSHTNLLQPKNKRRLIAKSQDLISGCLNILYTKPDTQNYIDELRDIEVRLQRSA